MNGIEAVLDVYQNFAPEMTGCMKRTLRAFLDEHNFWQSDHIVAGQAPQDLLQNLSPKVQELSFLTRRAAP